MPRTTIVFFREVDGTAPVMDWLEHLRRTNPRAFAKRVVRLERLAEPGHELRRPEADTLRDGIHELRARLGHVNYRLLYSFHGRVVAVLLNALTKEDAVPDRDIDLAVARKRAFEKDPEAHTFVPTQL
jgi:putative component of toxin-antitoxin plasmid stabilization module